MYIYIYIYISLFLRERAGKQERSEGRVAGERGSRRAPAHTNHNVPNIISYSADSIMREYRLSRVPLLIPKQESGGAISALNMKAGAVSDVERSCALLFIF